MQNRTLQDDMETLWSSKWRLFRIMERLVSDGWEHGNYDWLHRCGLSYQWRMQFLYRGSENLGRPRTYEEIVEHLPKIHDGGAE